MDGQSDGLITVRLHIPHTDPASYAENKAALMEWRVRQAPLIEQSWVTMSNEVSGPLGARRLRVRIALLRPEALADLPPVVVVTPIEPLLPAWCLVGRVPDRTTDGWGGVYAGSKHFAPGTELFWHNVFSGDGYERTFATGRRHDTGHFITLMQPTRRCSGWHTALVSDPIVLFELRQYGRGWDDPRRISAQKMLAEMLRREALAAAGAAPGEA